MRLGLALGLRHSTLKKIEEDCREKVDECMMEMLAAWLHRQDNVSQKGKPSWSVLRDALVKINEGKLAADVTTMMVSGCVLTCSSMNY